MNKQTIAFEPFGSLDGVLSGAPIKIMPIGTFYRGARKIEITSADLQQIADNLKAGLPRFRVPINENHAGSGKIGTVYDVAFDPQGADGPGLYATKYDLTDTGKQLLKEKRFDAVSPEMLWSKNDAKYQDPATGKQHDNVLVGLALTERPFFGHDNVALFCASPEATMSGDTGYSSHRLLDAVQTVSAIGEDMKDVPEVGDQLSTAKDALKKALASIMAMFSGKPAEGKIDDLKLSAGAIETDQLPPDVAGSANEKTHDTQEAETMSDKTPAPPETFTVSPEEFAALQLKAAQVDVLQTQAETFAAQLNETKAALAQTQRERDLDRMVQHADNFTAIPGTANEIGEKLLQLKEASPELFKWVDGLLSTLDKQLTQSELFAQHTTDRAEAGVDSFEALTDRLLAEKFNGDPAKYSEAMKLAETQRPDLARAYARRERGG